MSLNAAVIPLQEAGPSIKRTKTSDDSGLDMDNAAENGGGDSVNDGGASEIELVFRPHPTLMEKDDGHNRWRLLPLSLSDFVWVHTRHNTATASSNRC